ncbi:MAG: hypothetical protein K9J30_15200 [Bacteroidales bacterium]|nr:hypothetical protein [Bacteroidales bacterium]
MDRLNNDAIHACATLNPGKLLSVQLLNTTKEDILIGLQIKDQFAEINLRKNSLQTIQIQL